MSQEAETSEMDDFKVWVDRDADVPVGVQLDWALCAHIRDGRFKPGDQLPTLRELAEASGLNVNTVRAVYQRLEQKGLIDSHQGSGTFVALARRRSSDVATIAANAAREASETGVDLREVAAALYVSQDGSTVQASDGSDRSEADRRRQLRVQIASLERTLGEIEAEHPGVAPPSPQTRRGIGPALLSSQELEQVRALLLRRLTTVQTAIDEYIGESAPGAEPVRRPREAKAQNARASKRAPRAHTATRPAPAGT
jgi:GntR family transcriptional regulator